MRTHSQDDVWRWRGIVSIIVTISPFGESIEGSILSLALALSDLLPRLLGSRMMESSKRYSKSDAIFIFAVPGWTMMELVLVASVSART